MANPWAILTSDWHLRLGGRVWSTHPHLHGDVKYGLQQVQEYIQKYDPPVIFLAGDIIHEPRMDSGIVSLLNDFLDCCCGSNSIYFVQGQHDLSEPTVLGTFCRYAEHLENKVITNNDITVAGLDYRRPKHVNQALDDLPEADVLLTHQSWVETMGEYGTAKLPDKYKVVCSGDFHAHFMYDGKNTVLLSPGTLCMQRISEPPEHSIWLIYDDLSYKTLSLKSRHYFEYEIQTAEDLQTFLDDWVMLPASQPQPDVPDDIAKNIVRINYNPAIDDIVLKLNTVINNEAHVFLKPVHNIILERKETLVTSTNLVSVLEKVYPNDNRVGDAKKLLKTNNLSETVDEICGRFGLECC